MGAVWTILSILACAALLFTWKRSDNAAGQNAVWGAASLGLIGGVITAVAFKMFGGAFMALTVWKWIVVSVLVGVFLDGLASCPRPSAQAPTGPLDVELWGSLSARNPDAFDALRRLSAALAALPKELQADDGLRMRLDIANAEAESGNVSEAISWMKDALGYAEAMRDGFREQ